MSLSQTEHMFFGGNKHILSLLAVAAIAVVDVEWLRDFPGLHVARVTLFSSRRFTSADCGKDIRGNWDFGTDRRDGVVIVAIYIVFYQHCLVWFHGWLGVWFRCAPKQA